MSQKRKSRKSTPSPAPVQSEPPAPSPTHRHLYDRFFLITLLIAAGYRFLFLGRAELWQDELGFVNLAHTGLSPLEIWRNSWGWIISIGQLPLSFSLFNLCYRLIELAGASITPFTPGLARLPAVLFGIVGVWSTYRLAARVLDLAAARFAALMMAAFFFPVYYGRETYCYAQLLALTPLAVSSIVAISLDQKSIGKNVVLLLVILVSLLYSHLGALMIVVAMAASVLGLWIWSRWKKDSETARGSFVAGLTCGAALLLASPFIIRFALYNKAHTSGANYSPLMILNDVISKLFLGEQAWAALISWIVFLSGLTSLFLPHPERRPRQLLAWTTLLGLAALTWATHHSQYLSVRYFSPVSPLVLIVMGQGIYQLSKWVAQGIRLREAQRKYVFISLAALPLAVHGLVYTPALLKLTEKSVPFGAVAQWINENLEPGSPYLMESAYEIRWVGGSFPTPGRHPAAPYVHGSGPQEISRLHDRQMNFMNRFPEAPFIESAHHNWNTPLGLWTWPHRNFSQYVIVGNPEKLKRLIRWGIYPGLPHENLSEYSYRIDIYFSTWEDRVERARAEGKQVLPVFQGWEFQGQPISPQETLYFRVQRGESGFLHLYNPDSASISGLLQLSIALPGPSGRTTSLTFLRDNVPVQHLQPQTGQFLGLDVPLEDLPPGVSTVSWRRAGDDRSGEGLILLEAVWRIAE